MLQLSRKLIGKFTGKPEDRRVDKRHETHIHTVCRPIGDDVDLPVSIEDVSLGGIKLRIQQELRQGTMVRIDLPTVSGPHTTVLACVMHANDDGKGEWEVGCNFSLELADDEMRAFGAEKIETGREDLRAWVRHPARGVVEFRVLPGDDGPPGVAQLVDLSPAGVGLVVDDRLDPGTALTVALKRLDDLPDRLILVSVVYLTKRSDEKWAIGCNFLHRLTEKDLDELLWSSSF